jgi:hypothetical protein
MINKVSESIAASRLEICQACPEYRQDEQCKVLVKNYPKMVQRLTIVVTKAPAGCPQSHWLPTEFACARCGTTTVDETGVYRCSQCRQRWRSQVEQQRLEWMQKTKQAAALQQERMKTGPGTMLESLIPDFFHKEGCGCQDYARKMDAWGIEGCIQRKQEIIDHLCQQAEKFGFIKHFGIINRQIAKVWVNKAIKMSQEQTKV